MIIYIDKRLREWARWRVSGGWSVAGGAGWEEFVGGGDGYDTRQPEALVPVDHLECAAVNTCVMALEPRMCAAVMESYCRIGPQQQAATRLGYTVRTMYRHISAAHGLILGWLNDLACGIDVPAWNEQSDEAGTRQALVLLGTPADPNIPDDERPRQPVGYSVRVRPLPWPWPCGVKEP